MSRHQLLGIPGKTEWDSVRFHHATQNGMQFKTYQLFISGIIHLIFSDCDLLWLIETWKVKLQIKEHVLNHSIVESKSHLLIFNS